MQRELKKWNGMEWNGMEWNGMEWNGSRDLIEGREDVVGKLDLSNGSGTHRGQTNPKPSNSLLTQGCIEHSVLSCWIKGAFKRKSRHIGVQVVV